MSLLIRPIVPADDPVMAHIIRTVMPEFGADGPGFAIHDPEVDGMCAAYPAPTAAYFVVEHNGIVQGGAGIAALAGGDGKVCELKKMYFLPALRGLGAGSQMIDRCLAAAVTAGYEQCYLETLSGMDSAIALYQKKGFARIASAMGNTGHFGCNQFFLRTL